MKTAEDIVKLKLANYIVKSRTSTKHQANAILEAMEEYAEQFKQKWISVEEELPDHIKLCLILKDNSIGLASYSLNDKYWVLFKDGKAVEYTDIAHWMNLPKPPCK